MAGLIVMINAIQIYLTERTWFVMTLLQDVGGLMFMSHDVAQYIYTVLLPSPDDTWSLIISVRSPATIVIRFLGVQGGGIQ